MEILIIALVLLLVFTAGRLADLGDGLGRLIHGDPPQAPSNPAKLDAETTEP